ncbi:MAG: GntP family permease [Cyclobacteriaceae bacterium]|nr:GntP family permease [Cyclobacteriaceae bacterium]
MFLVCLALLLSLTSILAASRYLKLNPFFSLLIAALIFGTLVGKSILETITTMQAGFGLMLQQIGFLVAIGSCLGIVMERTGAMASIGTKIINTFGKSKTLMAMSIIGVVVGIPVYCDSGFIILSRLIPALASTEINQAQLSLALSTGLYTSHTLVPPTPGPLAAAANLGVTANLGLVILIGLAGALPAAAVAFWLSKKMGAKIHAEQTTQIVSGLNDRHALILFLPLMLPILLISSSTLPNAIPALHAYTTIFQIIGNPTVALFVGLLCAFLLISKKEKSEWPAWISEALKDAGVILLITGAGGSFGAVIKSSGIDLILKEQIAGSQSGGLLFLLIAFALGAILKTAQGSSTSAIIVTSSLLAPLTSLAGFESPTSLAILILAIGGGAMTVSHANDSYFWVVSRFSGIAENDAYKSYTLITLAQGITVLITSLLLFMLL